MHPGVLRPWRALALLCLLAACRQPPSDEPSIQVAAAASLRQSFEELAREFTEESGVEVVLVWGASGKLAHQIENGAPYDVFAAADMAYIDRVVAAGHGLASTRTAYARGALVLYGASSPAPGLEELAGQGVARIGLARPEHAPYGRAAMQALGRLGIRAAVEPKLVYGANVRQALHYAQTGDVDASFSALSLVPDPSLGAGDPRVVVVPPELYDPLDQGMVVLSGSRAPERARAFVRFALTEGAQAALKAHGFQPPGPGGEALSPGANGSRPEGASADGAIVAQGEDQGHGLAWGPLVLSLEVALAATSLALIIGLLLAALLAGRPFWGRELLDALVTTPLVLPPTVLGYYVLVLLGQRSPIGRWYHELTGSTIVFTVTGAVIAASIGALPLVVKSARAALEAVDPRLLGAARTLGASRTRAFFTVSLPLAAPGIIAGLMLAFARSLGDFGVTLMVAGDIPGRTQTAALFIYDAIQADREAQAAGMIAVLSAVAISVLYAVNKLTRGTRAW